MKARFELYGSVTGNTLRAAIAFEEAGVPYEVQHVDLQNRAHQAAAFLAINPAGKVPALLDHDAGAPLALAQSNAIILHVAEQRPGSLLPVDDAGARARTFERFFHFITDVIAVSHAAFALRNLDGAHAAIAFLEDRALKALLHAERFVDDCAFVAGAHFTIADIAGYTIARHLGASIPWQDVPNLQRWFAAVEARPAVQRGLHAFDRG